MRHNLWDRMMHRLLQEKKEKEVKASKSKGSKPDFLDLDKDGDKEEPMSKASKEAGGKKDAPKAKKGKGKIPPQLRMHINKRKKSKLDEAIEKLERILINEAIFNDFKKFDANWLHSKGKDFYNNNISAEVVFEYPGTTSRHGVMMGRDAMYDPKQSAPNYSPIIKRAKEKAQSGQFKPKHDTPVQAETQYWLDEVMAIKDKISPEAEMFADGSKIILTFYTEDTETFLKFAQNLADMSQLELDELGAHNMNVYTNKLKSNNGQNLVPYQSKRYRLKDGRFMQELERELTANEGSGTSAPGAVGGSPTQMAESLKRLEKLLEQYLSVREITEEQADAMLDEYGEEREPPQEEEDDPEDSGDFDSDEDYRGGSVELGSMHDDDDDDDDFEKDHDDFGDDDDSDVDTGMDDDDDFGGDDVMDWELDDEEERDANRYLSEAEVKKKQPRLGKVTRNPAGSKKKFHVYVKCGGRVKKISFGDPGLSIKRDSPARRKNFRARHKCDKPAGKDRCTARYWSCYQWRAGKKVEGEE